MRLMAQVVLIVFAAPLIAQDVPPTEDPRIHNIVAATSARRLERDITMLVSFGTRNTMSDTLSPTRGIGAARRWIKAQFDQISEACGGCLEVFYVDEVFPPRGRILDSTNVVNVVAIQRGSSDPNRMIIMSGDIDSRISQNANAVDSAPGANDNASGMAGTIEAARVLTLYRFSGSIVYLGLSGEEQGLYGGGTVARYAKEQGWDIQGVLNNDMIGNIEGVNEVIDNTTVRVFSDGTPPLDVALRQMVRDTAVGLDGEPLLLVSRSEFMQLVSLLGGRRRTGGDVDGISRQLARYVDRIGDQYIPNLDVMMIYRLDRFGRGGHHTPFANLGYPGVRIMETNENYDRQHQDIRVEDGIHYGDVLEGVDFQYAAKLTALNAATMAAIAWAPGAPQAARICGAVRASARVAWDPPSDSLTVAGYRVYWRLTDSPTWDNAKWIGNQTQHTFENLVIDNYFFGIASVSASGAESVVAFPRRARRGETC